MYRRLLFCTLIAATMVASVCSISFADLPARPGSIPRGKKTEHIVLRVDETKDVCFVRIPRDQLKALLAEDEVKQSSWAPGRMQTIVAALAGSVGVASVFLLRGKHAVKLALMFVVCLVVSGTVAEAWQFPSPRQVLPRMPVTMSGEVVLEVTAGSTVEVIVGTAEVTRKWTPPPHMRAPVPPSTVVKPR